jgi:hypothetical protein
MSVTDLAKGASGTTGTPSAQIIPVNELALRRAARAKAERQQRIIERILDRIAAASEFLYWAESTTRSGILLGEIDQIVAAVEGAIGHEMWVRYLRARSQMLRETQQ